MIGIKQKTVYLVLVIGIFFIPKFVISQSYLVHTYTEKDGLSNSSVYDVKQDPTGRMWFATRSGISVYDGFEWKGYSMPEGLPGLAYFKLNIDETGTVWAISQAPTKQISYLKGKEWVTLDIPQGELKDDLTSFAITSSWEGKTIAVGTSNSGVYFFKNNKWEWLNEDNGLISNCINAILFVESKFYIATDKGISIVDQDGINNNFMSHVSLPDSNIFGMATKKTIESGSEKTKMWLMGRNWLGYVAAGKFVFVSDKVEVAFAAPHHYVELLPDGNGGVYYGNKLDIFHYHRLTDSIKHFGMELGLVSEGTTAMLIDRERNLWIASLRGVSKIPSLRFANFHQKNGLLANEVTAIVELKPNYYIFGHPNGLTLNDGANFKIIDFLKDNKMSKSNVRVLDLCKDADDNVWAACGRLGLARVNRDGEIFWIHSDKIVNKDVTSVLVDQNNRVWILTGDGLYLKTDYGLTTVDLSGLPDIFIRKIVQGNSGVIYLATSMRGIYRFSNNSWEMLLNKKNRAMNNVYSILEDSNGKVWIGTIAGLCELNGYEIKKYQHNGFEINRPVYLILEDNKKRLWFGTDNGAIRWDGEVRKKYTVNNGFSGQETNRAAGLIDSYGRVWMGTDLGVSCYLEEFDNHNQKIPPPLVELFNMEVDGVKYPLENLNELSYNENNLVFRFRGLSFIDEKLTRFRTWLEGFDTNWSENNQSFNMETRYTNLPPGHYRFHLQAKNALGQWSEIVSSAEIIIHKPFWKTGWFIFLIVLSLSILIYIILKFISEHRYSTQLKIQVKERTAKLQESEQRLQKYNEVLLDLSTSKAMAEGNLNAMFKKITEITSKTNSVQRVGVWLYDESRTKIKCMDLYELDKDRHSSGFEIKATDYPEYFRSLQKQRTIASENAQTDPRTIEFAESYLAPLGITSILDTQIRIGGQGIGVICQEHIGDFRSWLPEEKNFGCSMADFISLTIEANDRKKVKEELEAAKELAEAANKSKSLFLANMSHEIRTPMNGIIGLTDILIETDLSPQQFQYLSMVKNSSAQLLVILNDILDFSKIEAGQLVLETTYFNLRDEVESVSDTVIHRLDEKKLELGILVQNHVPIHLVGDAGRLKQILLNLVGNAIKFTDEGEIIVDVSLEYETENEAVIHFMVKDTGIGIDPEKRSLIFECFTQAEDSTTRKYGGTGLGLAISSQLVRIMSGKIWVKSRLGEGSEFHFTVKLLKQEKSPREKMVLSNGFRDIKILAVDDNATNRLILSEMLKSFGCKYQIAERGEQLLHMLDHNLDCKVVITDFHMPEMDGKEVVTRILNSEKTSHIPIIILTSIGQNSETIGLAKLENVYAISKPVRQSQLFNAIITAFDKLDSTKPDIKQEVKQEDKVQIILDKISALKAKTGILLVEDNLVNQAVASSIIEMTGLAIDIAGDGQKAIEALQGKEYALVFMDVKMPNMDGLTATRIIRNDLKLNSMPIIAMTAHAMKGDREKCLEAGMNDYLSKPIIPEDLYKMIYQWLKKSEVLVKEKVYN